MKTPRLCAPVTAILLGLASLPVFAVDLRANDPLPPVPPGDSLLPPLPSDPAPTTPSTQPSTPGAGTQTTGKRNPRFQKLKNELELTREQIAKIKPIVESTRQQIKALRENTALPQKQKRQQIRQILASSFQQIRPFLTPQQIQKWKQIREERRAGEKPNV